MNATLWGGADRERGEVELDDNDDDNGGGNDGGGATRSGVRIDARTSSMRWSLPSRCICSWLISTWSATILRPLATELAYQRTSSSVMLAIPASSGADWTRRWFGSWATSCWLSVVVVLVEPAFFVMLFSWYLCLRRAFLRSFFFFRSLNSLCLVALSFAILLDTWLLACGLSAGNFAGWVRIAQHGG